MTDTPLDRTAIDTVLIKLNLASQYLEITRPSKTADLLTHIKGIRRQIWSLMADLENLTPEQLAELTPDLGILTEAADAALDLATRAKVAA